VLKYDQNVHIDSIFTKLQHGLLYYHQTIHNPTSVEHLGLGCKVEYTNANQVIIPESHNIWIQYTQTVDYDLDNTFRRQIPSFAALYFSCNPPDQILQCQEHLPAGKTILTICRMCKKTQQWVLHPQAQE
jgi:hypothetical protein